VGDPPAARGSAGGSRVGAYPIDHRRVGLSPGPREWNLRPTTCEERRSCPPGAGPPLRVTDHWLQARWRPVPPGPRTTDAEPAHAPAGRPRPLAALLDLHHRRGTLLHRERPARHPAGRDRAAPRTFTHTVCGNGIIGQGAYGPAAAW